MENNELNKAEEHLRKAQAELHDAEGAEHKALHEIEEAVEEIKETERHKLIHFFVDGEPCETEHRELTPNHIIRNFGGRDPNTNYLVQIVHGQKESYQGKGETPIKMHDGMRFQILNTGPMTVSDGRA
jgi:hypothetical protein